MVDVVSIEKRSQMMAGIKSKNTKPEILVRKILHLGGYGFRLHRKELPGKPDIVLTKWKCVIFVHGCFWHGHERCPLYRPPKSRSFFWDTKISKNKARDDHVRSEYDRIDWRYLEIWECALKGRARLGGPEFQSKIFEAVENCKQQNFEVRGYEVE